jgi:DNA polymerase-3 subunit delta'
VPRNETVTGFVGYAPYEGRRRIVVIDQAHTMNRASQNAVLKTLEEPPDSALVVLVTPAPGTLLPTVRSRCQSLSFAPVPLPEVRAHLEAHYGMDAAEARLRASLAPGSIGAAIAVDLETYREQLEAVVEALQLSIEGGAGIVRAADGLAGSGEGETATQRAASMLYVARDVLRDLLVVSSGGDLDTLVNIDRVEAWKAWADEVHPDGVAEALAAVNASIERFTTGITPNIKMGFELALSDVYRALSAETRAGAAR